MLHLITVTSTRDKPQMTADPAPVSLDQAKAWVAILRRPREAEDGRPWGFLIKSDGPTAAAGSAGSTPEKIPEGSAKVSTATAQTSLQPFSVLKLPPEVSIKNLANDSIIALEMACLRIVDISDTDSYFSDLRPTEHNDFINWIREGIVKSKGESHGNAIDQFAAYVLDYTRFIASSAGFATDAKGTCQIICEIILAEEDPKPEDVNDARLAVSNVASDLKVLEEKLDKLHKDLLRSYNDMHSAMEENGKQAQPLARVSWSAKLGYMTAAAAVGASFVVGILHGVDTLAATGVAAGTAGVAFFRVASDMVSSSGQARAKSQKARDALHDDIGGETSVRVQAVARSVKIYLQTMEHMRTRLEQTPFCEMDEVKIEATAWGELERMFSIIEMHGNNIEELMTHYQMPPIKQSVEVPKDIRGTE